MLVKFSPLPLSVQSNPLCLFALFEINCFAFVDWFAFVSLLEIERILSTVDDTTFGKLMQ